MADNLASLVQAALTDLTVCLPLLDYLRETHDSRAPKLERLLSHTCRALRRLKDTGPGISLNEKSAWLAERLASQREAWQAKLADLFWWDLHDLVSAVKQAQADLFGKQEGA
jgi:primosomal protein N''